jgi:hypothetical protein
MNFTSWFCKNTGKNVPGIWGAMEYEFKKISFTGCSN